MALFRAPIKRDFVSLVRILFLSHFQEISHSISAVCCLKYPYRSFTFHFCFLVLVVFLGRVLMMPMLYSFFLFWEFFTPAYAGVFFLESEGHQVSSPRLFSVFWPISTILWFGLSPLVLLFPSPPVPLPILLATIPSAPRNCYLTIPLNLICTKQNLSSGMRRIKFSWTLG